MKQRWTEGISGGHNGCLDLDAAGVVYMGDDQVGSRRRLFPLLGALTLVAASMVFGVSSASAGVASSAGGPTAASQGGGGHQNYYDDDNGGGNNGGNNGGGNNGGGNNGGGHHGHGHGGHGGHGHGGHGGHGGGGNCGGYTPSDLSINVPRAQPGQQVTVSGIAMPGTTVVISIRRSGGSYQQIGTAVVDANGDFSATVTIPNDMPAGTATIRVAAPPCPSVGTISLVIDPPQQGSCGVNPGVLRRGQRVTWTLFSDFADSNRRTKLTLVPRNFFGPMYTLFSGRYPNSGKVTFTVPKKAREGNYWVVQTGWRHHGVQWVKSCKVRVEGGYGGGGNGNGNGHGHYVGCGHSGYGNQRVLGTSVERPVIQVGSGSPKRARLLSATASAPAASTASVNASSIATTGSNVRPAIIAGLMCVGAATLLLLRRRRA